MERQIEITSDSGIIRGIIHIPNKGPNDKPIVVIVHGYFSSNRIGPARLYLQVARYLYENLFKVVRCDVLGVGDSDGDYCDITLKTVLRDFKIICNKANELSGTKGIILLGHSLGANISLELARKDHRVKKVILLNPEVKIRKDSNKLLSKTQLDELKKKGWTLRKGFHIRADYIDKLHTYNPIEQASKLTIPYVVIQGEQDEYYDPDAAKCLAEANKTGKLVMIKYGDHNFYRPDVRETLFSKILYEVKHLN